MSSICKYYTQAQMKNKQKKTTCDFSILSKANGINRSVFENINQQPLETLCLVITGVCSTVLVTYNLDLRPWQALLGEHPVLPYS